MRHPRSEGRKQQHASHFDRLRSVYPALCSAPGRLIGACHTFWSSTKYSFCLLSIRPFHPGRRPERKGACKRGGHAEPAEQAAGDRGPQGATRAGAGGSARPAHRSQRPTNLTSRNGASGAGDAAPGQEHLTLQPRPTKLCWPGRAGCWEAGAIRD